MRYETITKDVKYDLLSLSSKNATFSKLIFLINVAFEDAAFISLSPSQMWRLREEIRYFNSLCKVKALATWIYHNRTKMDLSECDSF